MFVHERQAVIVRQLAGRPRLGMTQLQRALKVSRSTLRRDLLELEGRGAVVRVHGGVMRPPHPRGESTFDRRCGENAAAKRDVAAAAAATVGPNQSVYVDAGSTALEVGRLLLSRQDVKLFTHSVALVALAAEAQQARASVVCVGGELRGVSAALVGGFALDWLAHLWFDTAFVGASGLAGDGASTTELGEAAVKQAVLSRSARCVLVCDASKCDRPAAVTFAPWGAFDAWFVAGTTAGHARTAANAAGVHVVACGSPRPAVRLRRTQR